jgi:predicted nucleic acid-binding protein
LSAKPAAQGLLDTSVFIATETGRPIREEGIPDVGAISIVTTAELRVGVFAAPDIAARDRRMATLEAALGILMLPVTEGVARVWAQMRVYLAAAGGAVNVNDLWIAATAAAHELPVITQDADFDALSGVAGLTVVNV